MDLCGVVVHLSRVVESTDLMDYAVCFFALLIVLSRVYLFAFASKCLMPAVAYAGFLAYRGGLNACVLTYDGCGKR